MNGRYDREVYKRAHLLPEIQTFGWCRTHTASKLGLSPHVHRDAYEICLITRGRVEWWVGRQIYELSRGNLFITRPGERHGGIDEVLHPCELYWLIISLPRNGRLTGMPRAQYRALANDFRTLRYHCFPTSSDLRDCFLHLHHEYRDTPVHAKITARGTLHRLLSLIVRDHSHAMGQQVGLKRVKSPAIEESLAWMEQRLEYDYTITQVAKAVGLGISHFHKRFLDEVGLTPVDYRNRLRVRSAKKLLCQSDRSIMQISLQLGFSTSQYFATVFKKLAGMSPREYRNFHQ